MMVKVGCCWLYAISKYGYPPSIADTKQALKDMKALGFKYVELEGVREENLREVYAHRHALKALCDDLGLVVDNFCPVLPDHELPNTGEIAETCTTVTLLQLTLELFRLSGDAKYMDIAERIGFNH